MFKRYSNGLRLDALHNLSVHLTGVTLRFTPAGDFIVIVFMAGPGLYGEEITLLQNKLFLQAMRASRGVIAKAQDQPDEDFGMSNSEKYEPRFRHYLAYNP